MTKKKTLLELAKEVTHSRNDYKKIYNNQDIELSIAWAKGEVTLQQIVSTVGLKSQTQAYSYIANSFKAYYQINK